MNNNRKLLFFDIDGASRKAPAKLWKQPAKTAICSSSTPDAPTQ